MSVFTIESLMSNFSELLMMPILLIILLLFVYSVFALGQFFSLAFMRRKNAKAYKYGVKHQQPNQWLGYDLHNYFMQNKEASEDELEVYALKKLENLRVVTRIAPMLGLIATMVPMGPALKALAEGNMQGISENLIIAFAAVIWSLAISSITFWPASVKKRWLIEELINVRYYRGA